MRTNAYCACIATALTVVVCAVLHVANDALDMLLGIALAIILMLVVFHFLTHPFAKSVLYFRGTFFAASVLFPNKNILFMVN